jgi:hypothetical protein
VALVPIPKFSGTQAAQLGFAGSISNPTLSAASIPVTAGSVYEFVVWAQSPNGWNGGISVCAAWSDGTTSSITAYPETTSWSPAVLTVQAPPTATSARFFIQVNGTPPPGPLILIDQAVVRLAYDQVPYLPNQSFDFDNSYLNNVVQASVTEGPITTASPTVQDVDSISKYFRRGPRGVQINGTSAGSAYDQANWNLQQYKDPSMRVRAITVVPSAVPSSFTRVLQNDVSDPVSMQRGPLNSTRYNLPVITQRVEHTIGPGQWSTAYQLSPYNTQSAVLQADSPPFDSIADNSLAW